MYFPGQYIRYVFGYKTNKILETLEKYAALADNQSNATAEQILDLKKMISHMVFEHHTIVRKYV